MDKKQAQQQITNVFSQSFDRERYSSFLSNLLNKVEHREGHYTGNYVPEAYREHINQYWRIGKYTDPDGEELDLLVVEVKSLAKLDRARSALRNFAINRLKQFEKEASLIAFYASDDGGADWRFSFVKIEHEAFKDEKGKVKLKEQLTPAKRYSYLVGQHENSHTACKQFLSVLTMDYADPRIEEIEAAFSIEKVTDEFFEQYKALFQRLAEHLKREPWFQHGSKEDQDQRVTRFSKKLLGQIVFLYFLQKKGWLGADKDKPWGTGPKDFMRRRFDAKADDQNFYRDCLQYLFYEALADERKGQKDSGYYERFDCRLPFLNGGLFEADYDWRNVTITIPDSIFHNTDKIKAGDMGTGTGILDIFDRYNFTIKEDEPLDKEVAVDPEMLGKVFENMLEVTERKSKGAFYTPREIVHYMCQESLIHYLEKAVGPDTDTAVPKADLEWLIRKGHLALDNDEIALRAKEKIAQGQQKTTIHKIEAPSSIGIQAAAIDTALADIKVCDPAIGSGAFPVGILHEIVHARDVVGVLRGNPIRPYDLKKHAIGNSIYGVDIDPSAIDIARLRLWLSLIVDEDDYATIDALPNLDYKIMQGNSLIEEFEGVKLFDDAFIQDATSDPLAEKKAQLEKRRIEIQREYMEGLQVGGIFDTRRAELDVELQGINASLKKIESAEKKAAKDAFKQGDPLFELVSEARKKAKRLEVRQREFFDASSAKQKRKLRDEITQLEWELIEATLKEQGKVDALAKLENFKSSGEKPYFLWKLNFSEVFRQKGGFDLIIGNPPYDVYEGKRVDEVKIIKKLPVFSIAKTGKFNAYKLFLAKSITLLKEHGVFCQIFQNSFLADNSAKLLREHFLKKQRILKLDSFPERDDIKKRVFQSAKMSVCILISENTEVGHYEFNLNLWKERWMQNKKSCTFSNSEIQQFDTESFVIPSINSNEKQALALASKLSRFGDYINCYQGEINLSSNKDIITTHASEITLPIIKGAGVQKWHLPKTMSQGEDSYLFYKRYLKGNHGKKSKHHKFHRIVMQGITGVDERFRIKSTLLDSNLFCGHSTNYISMMEIDRALALHYIAILNSECSNWFFKKFSTNSNVNSYEIHNLPCPHGSDGIPQLSALADYLMDLHKIQKSLMSSYFEQLIDGLVYELYFPNEIQSSRKEILPHLGDLKAIEGNMSDEEKLSIMQREFDRLYDPNHLVRNHLETLDSVPVIKTIREALTK